MTQANLPEINKLWNFSNPEESMQAFEKLLVEKKGVAPQDYTLQIKTQIARALSLAEKFEEARAVLREVDTLLSEETPIARVRYLLELGRTHNSSGEKAKAKKIFIQAYNYGGKIEAHFYSVDAAHMIGISSSTLEGKVEWNNKGLIEAKKSKDPKVRKWIGVFYNNIGWDLFEAKRYEEALEQFELCRDFYKDSGGTDRLSIAMWSIAKTYRYLGRTIEALEIQTTLIKEKDGNDESGYTFEELGELYLLLGEPGKAKDSLKKAYDILSKDIWLQKNEAERLERLKKLID